MNSDILLRVIQYDLKDREFVKKEIDGLSKLAKKDLRDKLKELINDKQDNLFETRKTMRSCNKQKEQYELLKRVTQALEVDISEYQNYLKMTA